MLPTVRPSRLMWGLAFVCVGLLAGCQTANDGTTAVDAETSTPTETQSDVPNALNPLDYPPVATLQQFTAGDRACYATVTDPDGVETEQFASFELCDRTDLLGQSVQLTYESTSIIAASCQGDPACEESESVWLITAMEPVSSPAAPVSDRPTESDAESDRPAPASSPAAPSPAAPPPAVTEVPSMLFDNADLGVCTDFLDEEVAREQSQIYALNSEQYLVEVLCFMAAYQGSYEYWLYEPGTEAIAPLSFQVFYEDGEGAWQSVQTQPLAGLPTYDPAQQELTLFTKYRGAGDCGSYANYQWQGSSFELVEFRAKSDCDGVALDVEDYPVIYP